MLGMKISEEVMSFADEGVGVRKLGLDGSAETLKAW